MSLAEIIEEIDLEEYLDSEGIDYKRTSGGDNLVLEECPFCGDRRGRVYFSRSKKRGVCFAGSCNAKFNLYSFARHRLGGGDRATFEHLERFSGRVCRPVAAPRPEPRSTEGWQLPASLALPTEAGMTHPYLLERGILPETQRRFGLRWCEDGWFDYEDVEGNPKRMFFGGRVLLPIYDLDGSLATFVGRDVTGAANVRYLFPPLLSAAGKLLYGGGRAEGLEHLVAGEGPFDCIGIHQAIKDHPDFRQIGAVATFGISIGSASEGGDDQLGRLIRLRRAGLKRLTIMWDGERKAFDQARKAAAVTTRIGLPTHIAMLPRDSDPGELDTATIRRAITEAPLWTPNRDVLWALRSPY